MTAKQLNVRLPEVIIDDINHLSIIYGSQAKALIAAVTNLRKEIEMKNQALVELEDISKADSEKAMRDAADRAIAAMKALSPEEQEEIAKQEFIRFKKFINDRLQ